MIWRYNIEVDDGAAGGGGGFLLLNYTKFVCTIEDDNMVMQQTKSMMVRGGGGGGQFLLSNFTKFVCKMDAILYTKSIIGRGFSTYWQDTVPGGWVIFN